MPFAGYLEDGKNVDDALSEAGFGDVQVRTVELKRRLSPDEFLAEKEIGARGRLAKYLLGPEIWTGLAANAREALRRRYGSLFRCSSDAIIAIGYKK